MKLLGMRAHEVRRAFIGGEITFCVIGLGSVGLPLACILADRGGKVYGVDIDRQKISDINNLKNPVKDEQELNELIPRVMKSGNLKVTTNHEEAIENSDVHIIIIPTLVDSNGKPLLDNIWKTAKIIGKCMSPGDVVITESTMPPGSTEKMIPILENESGLKLGEFGIAHCPERTMSGRAIRDITECYTKIIGADSHATVECVKGIYETINKKGVCVVSGIKEAEAVKVFEGIYRDVNIALANQLAIYCEEIGIDAIEVFAAANTQPYCNIHEPGAGVGGHCIPVYPHFVINTSKSKMELLITARRINDSMPKHVLHQIEEGLEKFNRRIEDSKIMIMGLTYRSGVKSLIKSPSLELVNLLRKKRCGEIRVYDPLCTQEDVSNFDVIFSYDIKGVDCLVFMTAHEEFNAISLEEVHKKMQTPLIVDARHVFEKSHAEDVGFLYIGIGRSL